MELPPGRETFIGDDCVTYRSLLELSYPITNGMVKDWTAMEHIWDYTFSERMGIDCKEHNILLTEPPMNPVENKKKMVETMIEKYNFAGVKVSLQAMLVLYAQGLMTGAVIDSGDGVTHFLPVYEGVCPPNLIKRLDVAGRHVTTHLIKLLQVRGYSFNSSADFETVRKIKEQMCFVGYDLEVETKLALETTTLGATYELPDGRIIKMDRERFEAPEVLFQPSLIDVASPGLPEMVVEGIQAADIDLRSSFYKHIVLSGGSTMYRGFPSRLEKEIKQLYLQKVLAGDEKRLAKFQLRIEDPPRRKHLVFLGGSVLADIMKDRKEFWISKEEWAEHGVNILHQK